MRRLRLTKYEGLAAGLKADGSVEENTNVGLDLVPALVTPRWTVAKEKSLLMPGLF